MDNYNINYSQSGTTNNVDTVTKSFISNVFSYMGLGLTLSAIVAYVFGTDMSYMRMLVSETGTLGLRGSVIQRWPQTRQEKSVTVHGHKIRIKIGSGRIKVENDDAVSAARALAIPLREVLALAEIAARQLN